eukprot:s973_g8.t2
MLSLALDNQLYPARIEGLSHLRSLNTLTIQKNKIGFAGVEDLLHLVDTTISTLDVQDNKIWDPDVLPEVFVRMADLRVLYLKGNPCAKKIPNYRKGITAVCENLKYLDDRPVFPEDRRAAEAFNRGGLEEERAERRRIKEEESAKHERNMKAFQDMIENVRREKRERDLMREQDKYTNASDPVISKEQRMQEQVERWKQEHADEIKDDAREHAERCLQSGDRINDLETPRCDEESDQIQKETKGVEECSNDKRKLVYEDLTFGMTNPGDFLDREPLKLVVLAESRLARQAEINLSESQNQSITIRKGKRWYSCEIAQILDFLSWGDRHGSDRRMWKAKH